MNSPKNIVIFLVIAFIIVIGITFATRSAEAPSSATNTSTPTAEQTYTLAQVALHSTKADCWTTVSGNVYNLTSFIPSHPGGDKILAVCGKDGTQALAMHPGGQGNPMAELAKHKIGTLSK